MHLYLMLLMWLFVFVVWKEESEVESNNQLQIACLLESKGDGRTRDADIDDQLSQLCGIVQVCVFNFMHHCQ